MLSLNAVLNNFILSVIAYFIDVSYKWDKEDSKWVQNEGISLTKSKIKSNEKDEEVDTDDEEKEVIRQDMSKGTYGTDGSTLTYTDPNDGSVYIWDKEKNAWFPKVGLLFSVFSFEVTETGIIVLFNFLSFNL